MEIVQILGLFGESAHVGTVWVTPKQAFQPVVLSFKVLYKIVDTHEAHEAEGPCQEGASRVDGGGRRPALGVAAGKDDGRSLLRQLAARLEATAGIGARHDVD